MENKATVQTSDADNLAGLACVRCGFDLQATDPEGDCPECGYSVAFTRSLDGQFWGNRVLARRAWWCWALVGVWLLGWWFGACVEIMNSARSLPFVLPVIAELLFDFNLLVISPIAHLALCMGLRFGWQRIPRARRRSRRRLQWAWLLSLLHLPILLLQLADLLRYRYPFRIWDGWISHMVLHLLWLFVLLMLLKGGVLLCREAGLRPRDSLKWFLPLLLYAAGCLVATVLALPYEDWVMTYCWGAAWVENLLAGIGWSGRVLCGMAMLWGLGVWVLIGRDMRQRKAVQAHAAM